MTSGSICCGGHWGKRGSVLGGVTGHQSQLKWGHCCFCTASSEVCPPLAQGDSDTEIFTACISHPRLPQCKVTISTPGFSGCNTVMNPSSCPCSAVDSSMGHNPFRGEPTVMCRYLWPQRLRGVPARPFPWPQVLHWVSAATWTYPWPQTPWGAPHPHSRDSIYRSQSLF